MPRKTKAQIVEDNLELLEDWRLAKVEVEEIKSILARERELRQQVFDAFFPEPKEGTNTIMLPAKWKLKGQFKLDRQIDRGALDSVLEQLRKKEKVNSDDLIEIMPKLRLTNYRALTKEQRDIFDQALVIKPQTPTIEIVPPPESKE